jgi:NAD(P)-dependent dehydrogenase (short-subunit alcohol dehydrogenase family)
MDRPVAIITGASRGIGRGIALELASTHRVAATYRGRRDAAESLAAATGAEIFQCDVGSAADRAALIEFARQRFGRLDLLVNNAGITSPGRKDLLEATEEGWDTVFNTNLKGPFFLSQLAANEMIRQVRGGTIPSGKIINVSSISAYAVSATRADYCLTKAAMGMMTRLFAQRLAEEKIAVFEICPGVIESDMTAPVKAKYDKLIAEGMSPIRRWGRPEDVAKAAAAVVLDYFPFSTGQRIDVDGGFHIRCL